MCSKRTIKNLIETTIDMQKVENDIISAKAAIASSESDSFKYIGQLKGA